MKAIPFVLLACALATGLLAARLFAGVADEQVVKVTARAFRYEPAEIRVKRGVPVRLEITSVDLLHGFNVPDLGLRADLPPNQTTTVRFTADKAGTYEFHCDNFCGSGHEDMRAAIVVSD